MAAEMTPEIATSLPIRAPKAFKTVAELRQILAVNPLLVEARRAITNSAFLDRTMPSCGMTSAAAMKG
jgi:hypothetical protein